VPANFLGYSTEVAAGQLLAIVQDGVEVTTLATGQAAELLFNQTPFYAESGGQQGDIGLATTATGQAQRAVIRKKLIDGLHVHRVQVVTGTLTVGHGGAVAGGGRPSQRPARAPFRHPPAARKFAAAVGIMSRKRDRWWRPTFCALTSAIPSR
jgi:hypothetical protein